MTGGVALAASRGTPHAQHGQPEAPPFVVSVCVKLAVHDGAYRYLGRVERNCVLSYATCSMSGKTGCMRQQYVHSYLMYETRELRNITERRKQLECAKQGNVPDESDKTKHIKVRNTLNVRNRVDVRNKQMYQKFKCTKKVNFVNK